MAKFFAKSFFLFLVVLFSVIIFLSYFGIETDKFDNLIKNKTNEVNKYVKLDFQKTKIYLNPKELKLVVKLQNPKIIVKKNEIILSKLNLFLPLRSFVTSDFLLERAEVAFFKNDIKDLTKITSIFLPRIINKQIKKIFPFEADGKIGKNYAFSGKVSEAFINLSKDFSLKNLTLDIRHSKDFEEDGYNLIVKKGYIYDVDLTDSSINLKRKEKETNIASSLKTKGKLNFSQIKKITSLFGINTENFKDINANGDLKTNINFNFDKKFKIKNLTSVTEGDIFHFEVDTEEKKFIKKYLPEYDTKIIFKNNKIKIFNSKSKNTIEVNGSIKVKDSFDNFTIKETYNHATKNFDIKGNVDLTNSKIKISKLNYSKKNGKKSKINFDISFVLDKYLNIKTLNFLENKTKIHLSEINLNSNLELENFKKLEVKTFAGKIKNNDFSAEKLQKIVIFGEVFDAQPFLKELYKKSGKKTFSKNFNSDLKVNFNKTLTGSNDDISNFAMISSINKGSYEKLSLKGNFSENEIVEMSIYQVDKDKRTLQVVSDRAKPFIINFDFIKGFEGGKLEYDSVISKDGSESNLLITDFKVSKVPALAQLLTLASLQGIADTLSGEGIRFESFEMKTNSKDNVLNIDDALAMGPAVSILLSGYVDRGKVVSLRGTLVPATKLNAIIASIPLVGDILVGKKTGEGVVGVSFKMKGPPKDIKTTVNPIKTLTPRFIVRAVEKIKKKKKEESK